MSVEGIDLPNLPTPLSELSTYIDHAEYADQEPERLPVLALQPGEECRLRIEKAWLFPDLPGPEEEFAIEAKVTIQLVSQRDSPRRHFKIHWETPGAKIFEPSLLCTAGGVVFDGETQEKIGYFLPSRLTRAELRQIEPGA